MGNGMRRTGMGALLAMVLAALLPWAARGEDAAERPLSPAQTALFASDHLSAILKPLALDYSFLHDGGASARYSDKVELTVEAVHRDGKKDIAVDFLSGKLHMPFASVSEVDGNPLLIYFLQYDVIGMGRATGGAPVFFRNRIREAFLDGAEMHPVKIALAGKEVDGTEIVIHPYAGLALPAMARYSGKSYRFLLSAAVPGTLYRIESEVPATADAPAVTESVTWSGERP